MNDIAPSKNYSDFRGALIDFLEVLTLQALTNVYKSFMSF